MFVPGVTPPTFTTTPPSLTEAKRYPQNTYDNLVLYEDYEKQSQELARAKINLTEITQAAIASNARLDKELEAAQAEIAKEKEQKLKWASKAGGYVVEIERLTQALKVRDEWKLVGPARTEAMLDAGLSQYDRVQATAGIHVRRIFDAMLLAAPPPTESDEVK